MKTVFKSPVLIAIICIAILSGCKKVSSVNNNSNTNTFVTKYTNPKTTTVACDYDVSDTALTNHGWSKTFDDEFDGDLSKWSTIHGGLEKEL
ncbi:MAG TPA: hypothetical protein VFE54_14980, partial [Mucilaginibacter sp.]|nr:hypothetical protein [Mucilaginibacter sp.]